jgi:hypothetical protein
MSLGANPLTRGGSTFATRALNWNTSDTFYIFSTRETLYTARLSSSRLYSDYKAGFSKANSDGDSCTEEIVSSHPKPKANSIR